MAHDFKKPGTFWIGDLIEYMGCSSLIHEYHFDGKNRRNITLNRMNGYMFLDDGDDPLPTDSVVSHLIYLSYRVLGGSVIIPHSIGDNPAVIHNGGNRSWWMDGTCHRWFGPAFIASNGSTSAWYWHGEIIRDEVIHAMMDRAGLSHDWQNWTDHDRAVWRMFV